MAVRRNRKKSSAEQSSTSVNRTLFPHSSRSSSHSHHSNAEPSFFVNLPTEIVLYILSIASLSSRESALAISRLASWTYPTALKGLYSAVVIYRLKTLELFSASIISTTSKRKAVADLGGKKIIINKGSFVRGIWLVPILLATTPRLSLIQQIFDACPNLIDLALPAGWISAALRSNVPFRYLTITTPAFRYDWDSGGINILAGTGASIANRSVVLNTLSNITHLIILRTDAESQFLPTAQMHALTYLAYPLAPLGGGRDHDSDTSPEVMLARTEALGAVARQFLNASRVNLQMLVLHFKCGSQRGRKSLWNFAQGLGLHFGRYADVQLHPTDSTSSEDSGDTSASRSFGLSLPQEARILIRAAHACDPRVYALPLDFNSVEPFSRKMESLDAQKIWDQGVRSGQSGVFAAAVKMFALCNSIGS